ncbi:SDR family oxidoreductase [Actinomadura mexicana]|uniref:NADP-dependent 3-hydroxy acid dehydrogenase YdfG n=1 Tax=Actinomadura mexicana TaxID=134959 RepID=A0A239FWL3_9ACTN|nr:SDR family oxidoreductase [Actinomadura mexicana]SNS61279.1 NADP-dependent 3-hydroxy acid dehydrogenase YdfG [Actinomadura mexicana]
MTKRIALITGANKGLGFETARILGQGGATVLVGARSPELGEKAAAALSGEGIDARFIRIDVTDAGTVERAAEWIDAEYGRLDILVNNAGISPTHASDPADSPPPSRVAPDLVRAAFETNVIGVVAVTGALLPLLRRSPAGRIVNVSSNLGSLTRLTDPAGPSSAPNLLPYNASKTALNAVTVAYARELAGTPVKVNSAAPGYCATDLNGHTGFRTAAQGAAVIAGVALLGDDGPTGAYIAEDGPVPW